jgi:hypothetical protein
MSFNPPDQPYGYPQYNYPPQGQPQYQYPPQQGGYYPPQGGYYPQQGYYPPQQGYNQPQFSQAPEFSTSSNQDDDDDTSPSGFRLDEKSRGILKMIGGKEKLRTGIKEALNQCINNSIRSAGQKDGFFHNKLIKILIPAKFHAVTETIKKLGFGQQLDEFEHSMNRAAEQAVPAGTNIFVDIVTHMHLDDITRIWKGSDTSVTDFFKEKASTPLTRAFSPIVKDAVDKNDVTHKYTQIRKHLGHIPFMKDNFDFDIFDYTTTKTIEGLFSVMRQEEVKLRHDPASRVTDMLKIIF